jgi:hypothetical protein
MCLLTTLSTFYPSFMFLFQLRHAVMFSSVIRVSGKQCFLILIGSGFNQVSGSVSGFGIRIRIQKGKNYPQKQKKLEISCVKVLDVLS